jgi:hypothetical protein
VKQLAAFCGSGPKKGVEITSGYTPKSLPSIGENQYVYIYIYIYMYIYIYARNFRAFPQFQISKPYVDFFLWKLFTLSDIKPMEMISGNKLPPLPPWV